MKVKIWRDPYDCGVNITKKREIDFPTGLTIFVGCNGAGKSTLLRNIKEFCSSNNFPCIGYDNLHDGGHHSLSNAMYFGNFSEGALLLSSSEGECVKINASRFLNGLKEFVQNGFEEDFGYRFAKHGLGVDLAENLNKDIRVILLDALDSGLSVDSLVELREALDALNSDIENTGLEYYIFVTANEYELTVNHRCLDVESGKFVTFSDYNDYRDFIVNSRKKKEERIDHMLSYIEKKRAKELEKYKKIVEKAEIDRQKILSKYPPGTDVKSMGLDRYELDSIDRRAEDYLYHGSRYLSEEDVKTLSYSRK